MAQFQKREYHPDTTQKRRLTCDDVMFLQELQHELNTQPNMGNADPVFWTIAQGYDQPVPEDMDGDHIAVDSDGDIVARDLKTLAQYLDDGNIDRVSRCTYFKNSAKITLDDGTAIGIYDIKMAVQKLNEHGITDLTVQCVETKTRPVPDTLFLTHKDCEEHLKNYDYNYHEDAHAYAMTAIRSPRFERLLKLLRQADWGSLTAGAPGDVS